MSGGIEAAGDAITGGLIGRAVEPAHGESGKAGHGACLNCGTPLIGAYCHACGQSAHLHRSLGALWHDIAHGVLHFEGKIWRTLPMLAWRPGELTRRYIHGERARFVSPMALFLFSIFVMFALISALGASLQTPQISKSQRAGISHGVGSQVAIQRKGVLNAERRRAEAAAAGQDTTKLDADLKTRRAMLAALEGSETRIEAGQDPWTIDFKTGLPRLDKGIAKAQENPNLALYKIQTNAYKFSWALIPISVPFVWLMFAWRRKFHLYDHAIFVTYSLSFMSLLAILLTILYQLGAGGGFVETAAVVIPPIHLYRQLKGAYELGRWGAGIRTVLLTIFCMMALVAFLLLLLGFGLAG